MGTVKFPEDEMGGFPGQDTMVRAEIEELIGVANNLNSEQNSLPTMGLVQNALMGCYDATHLNPILRPEEFMDCLLAGNRDHVWESLQRRAKLHGLHHMSGRALVSAVFPEDFCYTKGDVKIRDGILIDGTLTKATVGRSGGSIIQYMWHIYGKHVTVDFITDLSLMMYQYMRSSMYSVGISDCHLPSNIEERIDNVVKECDKEVKAVVAQKVFHDKKMQNVYVEGRIVSKLNDIRNKCQKLALDCIDPNNRFLIMINSGSKGSMLNHTQISVALGQQLFGGSRMQLDLDNGTRALPCFPPGYALPEGRGFVKSPFSRGLSPHEFFFHMMGGREGLMDTATKTSETGYLERRLVKTFEDCTVQYDGTVRSGSGGVISILSGGNYMDPGKQIIVRGKALPYDVVSYADFLNMKCISQAKISDEPVIEPYGLTLQDPYHNKTLAMLNKMYKKKKSKELKKYIADVKTKINNIEKIRKNLKKEYRKIEKGKNSSKKKELRVRIKCLSETSKRIKGN